MTMTPTDRPQKPEECRYYRKGYCIGGQILLAFDKARKTPCEIVEHPEVYCLGYQRKKKWYEK